jgi:hypothetical protein
MIHKSMVVVQEKFNGKKKLLIIAKFIMDKPKNIIVESIH